jgi:hypothetical protein
VGAVLQIGCVGTFIEGPCQALAERLFWWEIIPQIGS